MHSKVKTKTIDSISSPACPTVFDKPRILERLKRAKVAFNPTTPQYEAGMRIEPPPSVPKKAQHN